MQTLLEFILTHLVDNPDDVRVVETEQEGVFVYTLHVHADDIGKIIGKQGATIHAIRQLAKIRAVRDGIRVSVTVAEATPATEVAA